MIRIKLNEVQIMNEDTAEFEELFVVVVTDNFMEWICSGFGRSWNDYEFKKRKLAKKCIEAIKKNCGKNNKIKVYYKNNYITKR